MKGPFGFKDDRYLISIQMNRLCKIFCLKPVQLFVFFGFIGCLTPIDFPVEIAGGQLVFSGQISTLSEQNIIELGTTAETLRLPFPIGSASIMLYDDLGNSFSYLEDGNKPGVYTLPGFAGVPGRSYHIEVILPNKKVYRSTPEKMPDSSQSDTVYYEVVEENVVDFEGTYQTQNFLKIYANTTLSHAHDRYLRWRVYEAFLLSPTDFPDPLGSIPPPCFIVQNADPQRVVLFDESTVTASAINGQLVGSRLIDWSFIEKHYITTYQSSITKESFEYWRKVNILANQVGSIFDTPPAEIEGNIISVSDESVKALGFFQASNDSYKRFFLHRVNLPFPILNGKCDFDGDFDPGHYPYRCINCTSVRNSSFTRPAWF